MPRTTAITPGMSILVQRRSLTDDDWERLIEMRISSIKPHLDRFTLEAVGDFTLVSRDILLHDLKKKDKEQLTHPLTKDNPVCAHPSLSLKTQGIFPHMSSSRETDADGFSKINFWGLTRSAVWIMITIHYIERDEPKGYQQAVTVKFEELSLQELAKRLGSDSYLHIWDVLGLTIQSWAINRQRLYETAKALAEDVTIEESIYHYLRKY